MGRDFNALYDSGIALWHGQYTGLYPLPANGLFALLALLPRQSAFALAMFVGLTLFVVTFKRQALLWMFFQPILASLWLGQLDLIWLWLLRQASPVSLALLTLKPQLFPLALPALLSDRSKWRPFALACLGLYGSATIIRPTWPLEWLRQCNDGRLDWVGSTTILAQPMIGIVLLLVASVLMRLDWRAVFWSCNPTLRWYDFTLLAGGSLWLIPLSWLAWGLTQMVYGNPWPVALLGLADLVLRRVLASNGAKHGDIVRSRADVNLDEPSTIPVGRALEFDRPDSCTVGGHI